MIKYILLTFFGLLKTVSLFAQTVEIVEQGKSCSIRGLSVVNDKIAWASGSKGQVAITLDGGKTWNWHQVKNFEQSDFRDIEAFSEKEAIIMSSGTPALILKTLDGGKNWQLTYRNDNPAYFLDAMDFFNRKHAAIMGDPVNGKFLLLETKNGGKTWAELQSMPDALPNEAAFAASGTCMRVIKRQNKIVFITGGSVSRYFSRTNLKEWISLAVPLMRGKASKGAFSIAAGGGYTVIVGGDYQKSDRVDSVACYYGGKNKLQLFHLAERMPAGYQSCVAYINRSTFLSTGTPGTNITTDGGKNWMQIDKNSFNVCSKARHGTLVLLAGDQGKIAQFKNH